MMKRILSMLLAFAFIISLFLCVFFAHRGMPEGRLLTACMDDRHRDEAQPLSNKQNSMVKSEDPASERVESDKEENGTGTAEDTEERSRILIAYFTWAENVMPDDLDAMTSASVKSPGNVAQLAQWIGGETGGDLFSIQVAEPYPADWDDCLSRANKEKADGMHPALSETLENISEYDTIFLGYPNWWYSCPMALFSFIDEYDLSEKKIYLFCSHGTGGLAGSVRDITAALPESAVISDHVFHVYQEDVASAEEDLQSWLNELQYE